MGEATSDLEHQIVEARTEMALVIDELQQRARALLNVRRQAEDHPTAVRAVGGALVLALGLGTFTLLRPIRKERTLTGRLKRFSHKVRDYLPINIYVGSDRVVAGKKPATAQQAVFTAMAEVLREIAMVGAREAGRGIMISAQNRDSKNQDRDWQNRQTRPVS